MYRFGNMLALSFCMASPGPPRRGSSSRLVSGWGCCSPRPSSSCLCSEDISADDVRLLDEGRCLSDEVGREDIKTRCGGGVPTERKEREGVWTRNSLVCVATNEERLGILYRGRVLSIMGSVVVGLASVESFRVLNHRHLPSVSANDGAWSFAVGSRRQRFGDRVW